MRKLFLIFWVLMSSLHAAGIWHPHVELEGRAGDFRRGGGVQLFAPVYQDGRSILFAQALGGRFLNEWAGSLGFGVRRAVDRRWGWGANTFIDVARSELDRTYVQLGVGVEMFGPRSVGRANAYVVDPHRFKNRDVFSEHVPTTGGVVDHFIETAETALYGGDVELGKGWSCCGQEVWVFGGGYAYDGPGIKTFVGPRARMELRLKERCRWEGVQVTIAGEYQWDRLRPSQGSVILKIKLPIGKMPRKGRCCPMTVCQRMGESVHRENAIWLEKSVRSGESFIQGSGLFFVSREGMGSGLTQSSPTNIDTVQGLATTPGDVIVLLSTDGNPIELSNALAPYPLLLNQTMAGFAGEQTITVNLRGRRVVVRNESPASPTAELTTVTPTGDNLISAAGGNIPGLPQEIFGFDATGAEKTIVSSSATNMNIRDMTLSAPNDTAIELSGGSSVNIDSVTITGLPDGIDGITFAGSNLTVSGGTSITGPGTGTGSGIALTGATDVKVRGSKTTPITITDMGNGITSTGGSSLTVEFATIEDSVDNGITLDSLSTGGLDNVIIDGAGAIGLELITPTGPITATNSTLSVTGGGQGIRISGGTGTLDLAGLTSTITGPTVTSVEVSGATSGTISLGPTTITGSTTATAVDLSATAGAVDLNLTDFNVTTTGTGIVVADWKDVAFDGTNAIDATTGLGLSVTTADTISGGFNTISSSSSPANGILLMSIPTGSFAVRGGTITAPTDNGLEINTTGADLTYVGTISEAEMNGVLLEAATGIVTIGDGTTIEKSNGANGGHSEIFTADLVGTLNIGTTPSGASVTLRETLNGGTLLSIAKTTAGTSKVSMLGALLDGNSSSAKGARFEADGGVNLVTNIQGANVNNVTGNGVEIFSIGNGGGLTTSQFTIGSGTTVPGINFLGIGGDALLIGTDSTATDTVMKGVVKNSTFTSVVGRAVHVQTAGTAGTPSTVEVFVGNSQAGPQGASADFLFDVTSTATVADTLTVEFNSTQIVGTSRKAFGSGFGAGSAASMNLSLISNEYAGTAPDPAYSLVAGNTTGILCTYVTGNSASNALGNPSFVVTNPGAPAVRVVAPPSATTVALLEQSLENTNSFPNSASLTGAGGYERIATCPRPPQTLP